MGEELYEHGDSGVDGHDSGDIWRGDDERLVVKKVNCGGAGGARHVSWGALQMTMMAQVYRR